MLEQWSEYKNHSGGAIRFLSARIKQLEAEELKISNELQDVQMELKSVRVKAAGLLADKLIEGCASNAEKRGN